MLAECPMHKQTINTENFPLEHRKDLWLSQVLPGVVKATGTRSGELALDIEDMERFRGEWQYADIGSLRFSRVACTPSSLHINSAVPLMCLIFQLGGMTHLRKGKGEILLMPGNWAASQGSGTSHLTHRTSVEHLVLLVDQHPFDLEGVEALRSFAAKQGVCKLVHEFVCDTFTALPIRGQAGDEIAEITIRLLRQAVVEAGPEARDFCATGKKVSVDDIKRFIDEKLGDPLLSLKRIAVHFSCSKRTLQRIFAANGDSVERYIWRRRIERCMRELDGARSLTELAYRYGFNSSTHFSRLFKMHCGMTPTEFIRLQRREAGFCRS